MQKLLTIAIILFTFALYKNKMDMKTQIANLKSGVKFLLRKEEAPKWSNGTAGTDYSTRLATAKQVRQENPNGLTLKCNGVQITLEPKYGLGDKFKGWYNFDLTSAQYKAIMGRNLEDEGQQEQHAHLVVFADCSVAVVRFARKNPRCDWRMKEETAVDEAFFEII